MPTKTLIPPTLLRTPTSASHQLGVPLGDVRSWIASGELRTVTLPRGNRLRVLQASIDEKYRQLYGDVQQTV